MNFEQARKNMVESQLRPSGITDEAVIKAFGSVARENFVSGGKQSVAYTGDDLAIGNGRYLLDPRVLGLMLQCAHIKPDDIVLDIGSGSGYSAGIIAHLAESVVGVEADSDLCVLAGETLLDLDVTNVAIICGKHRDGAPAEAPFDVIVLNGRVSEFPAFLGQQLKEGGRLVAIVGEQNTAAIVVGKMRQGKLSQKVEIEVASPVLAGFENESKKFVF